MDGILLVDKPHGWTSHDVVAYIRKKFKIKKVGHCGTLDPLATGLLIVLLGKSTKTSKEFLPYEKTYSTVMKIGATTNTGDRQGNITQVFEDKKLEKKQIVQALQTFLGESFQVPPMVSAIKIRGRKLYEMARKGIKVQRKPKLIKISKIEFIEYNHPYISFNVRCSGGTYIRSLIEDIAKKINTGAHMTYLRRIRIGEFDVQDALPPTHI